MSLGEGTAGNAEFSRDTGTCFEHSTPPVWGALLLVTGRREQVDTEVWRKNLTLRLLGSDGRELA